MKGTTEQGAAAMKEFGFSPVALNEVGAPTPGRIADRIADVVVLIDEAAKARSWNGVVRARAELSRLLLALDAWDAVIMNQIHDHPDAN